MQPMRTIDVIQGQSSRNQSLRLLMILIIAGTFPFYCFAIYFIGSAPVDVPAAIRATDTPSGPAPTFTALGANLFLTPAATSGPPALATNTPLSLPIRTPIQFVPPTAIPAQTIVAQTVVSPSPIVAEATSTATATATAPGNGAGPADADFDGIADAADQCPDNYGYADNQGCPYDDDEDRDGIRDAADACPNEFAPGAARGCRDFDDDGLDTAADECPNEAGPAANQGCPLTGEAGG